MKTFILKKSGFIALATTQKTEGYTTTTTTVLMDVSHATSENEAIGIAYKELAETRPDEAVSKLDIIKVELDSGE